jgi:hypothetical protein
VQASNETGYAYPICGLKPPKYVLLHSWECSVKRNARSNVPDSSKKEQRVVFLCMEVSEEEGGCHDGGRPPKLSGKLGGASPRPPFPDTCLQEKGTSLALLVFFPSRHFCEKSVASDFLLLPPFDVNFAGKEPPRTLKLALTSQVNFRVPLTCP